MKILVTGGCGFIGSHLVDALLKENHSVIIIDNLSTSSRENLNPRANFYEVDLRDFNKVEEIFESEKPEIIYHLAAQINVRASVENPSLDAKINILSTLNLLELAVKHKIKHFIFSSTGGAIYGNTKNIPTTETELEKPLCPYGIAKLSVEKYLHFYKEIRGLKYTVLRYSNVYGPRQNPKGEAGIISIFFDRLFSKKIPVIFGGLQTRDFVFVKDVVRANLLTLQEDKSSIYNISTGKSTDIIDLFNRINKYFKNVFEPEYQPKKPGEQTTSCLSYEKAKKNLNWQPEITLDEGLSLTYTWYLTRNQ
jgi:UDP-glucose 4-epimerase